jgi:hypothetical protein
MAGGMVGFGEDAMKKLLLAGTALAFGGQALAADLPLKAPMVAVTARY